MKICLYDRKYILDLFENSAKVLEEHPELVLYEYDGNLDTENIQIGDSYYRWCIGQSLKDKKT